MSDPISAYVCADCTVANFSKDNCINCGSTNVVDRPPVAASEEPEAGDPWSIIKPFLSLKLDEIRDDDHLRVIQAAMRFLDVTPTPAEPEGAREALEEIREIICDPTSNCYPELNLGHQMKVNDIICKVLASQPEATEEEGTDG